jgi:cellulose biosynthesis protein BcsQ
MIEENIQVDSNKFIPKEKNNKIIAMIQNKGGSFRTSLAFAIAKNFLRNNRTVRCVDYDQQQNLNKILPEICQSGSGIQANELKNLNADYTIVDTPPTIDSKTIQVILNASLVLVPIHLSKFDVEQSQELMETIRALNVTDKVKIIIIHNGTRTNLYKNLQPYLVELASEYNIEIICEMTRNESVPQGILQGKTVFEFNTPPSVRGEFKTLFKELGKSLVQ